VWARSRLLLRRALDRFVDLFDRALDLDTIADLRWLACERERAATLCARTLAFLDRVG